MHATDKANIRQCRTIAAKAGSVEAHAFFNLLTGPELFDAVELALPPHRERVAASQRTRPQRKSRRSKVPEGIWHLNVSLINRRAPTLRRNGQSN